MSFRIKLFTILGMSQAFLAIFLITSFVFLIENIKSEPQEKRDYELAGNFQKELKNKEKTLQNLAYEIKTNSKTINLLRKGMKNRQTLVKNAAYFQRIMDYYSLDVFEIGDTSGKVFYRFHRPSDYGDDKSQQVIIKSALNGKQKNSLELGHSGLALRLADSIPEFGTFLIGYVVNDSFTHELSGGNNIHLAILKDKKIVSSSDPFLANIIDSYDIQQKSHVEEQGNVYYAIEVPYMRDGKNYLSLKFLVFINETDIQHSIDNIWKTFAIVTLLAFGISILFSYLLAKDVIGAVRGLSKAMVNFDTDEKQYIKTNRKDEIGRMGKIFSNMKEELIEHQKNLELKVSQRTEELENSLAQIRKLKEIQDGDYYLTSLLINPLSKTLIESESIEIETLVKQKKQFQFRNRQAEIGGDLCAADKIILKQRHYVVFMNADAMGKSIQGAGGALVLGTVFKSIVQNTHHIPSFKQKHPERWLKDCIQELQNVFISFDGSMLVSATIGLICEETGTLYYINSEHPFSILYRDHKASFLESETLVRKIGVEQDFRFMKIHVHSLKPGDSIILGSDGRDDLILEKDGVKLMNEDETHILEVLEKGRGSLAKTETILAERGEFTDDFTMMRIAFKKSLLEIEVERELKKKIADLKEQAREAFQSGKPELTLLAFEEALKIHPGDSYTQKELIKLYLKIKDYPKALELCISYLEQKPGDTDALFYSSFLFKEKKELERAIDYGERVLLRNPEHRENLLNLAEAYTIRGDTGRASYLMKLLDEQLKKRNELTRI
ncbi:MAG: SpoIIE family protein phosphatase [Spirochaetota bacterium]